MINELAKKIYQNAVDKGFYDNGQATNIGERIALIHSELSEALEADRKNRHADLKTFFEREQEILKSYNEKVLTELGKTGVAVPIDQLSTEDFISLFKSRIKDTFEDELADAAIRIMDTCGFLGIDLEKHIELKMRYNSTRERMHGKKY